MTRINTNVSSLIAQKTLARSNVSLQEALTRLSTGLRINTGKDDPAGLIASEVLRSDVTSVQRAISNSERANQLISTADSALGQVSTLLNDIRGLVSEAANTGALSQAQIDANQLQLDSSLEAIDRIAQTTSFQGRRLLDGSLDFLTTGIGTADTRASGTFGTTAGTAASGSFGTTPDAKATVTLSGSAGGTGNVAFTAQSAGTNFNGYKVQYVRESGGATSATFDGSTNVLQIKINSATTAASVVAAVAANNSAAAVISASVSAAGLVASAGAATTSATLAGGTFDNSVTISAVSTGTAFNNVDITFSNVAATGSETAVYNTATNTLTINKHANSTTAQVIQAINATGVFSAATTGDGFGTYAAGTTADVTTGGVDNNLIILSASTGGPAYNNLRVVLSDSAATGSETAAFNTGTTPTLTVYKHANSTTAQIVDAINATGVFSASTSGGGLGVYTAGTTNNVTTGGATGTSAVSDLKIDQANFGTANNITVQVNIDRQATQGTLTYSGGTLTSDLVLEVGGKNGFEVFNFGNGTTVSQIAVAINQVSDSTGVSAEVTGSGLSLRTAEYGADAFVSAKALTGSFATKASGVAATRTNGTDVALRINGVQAEGRGLAASLNTSTLDLSFTVNENFQDNSSFTFDITGGGAIFQLGPDVTSNQQARLGIRGVSTATLGGVSGTLFELRSGGAKDLSADAKAAAKVIDEVITSVTGLRGRLGAFQKTTLDSNIVTLNDTLETLTDAESSIRDADFAAESARLTRAQILVQAGTSVLQIANTNPQNVLALLRG